MALSISAAWTETAAFVKREAGLLFPIALAFLAVPSIVAQYAMPQATPGQTPELGAWTFIFIPLLILTLIGSLAISALALRPAQSVHEAIVHSLRRFLPAFGALALMALSMLALLLPMLLLIGFLAPDPERMEILVGLAILAIFTFVWIRLMLATPIAVAEAAGPVQILKRSWRLTGGHFNKLIIFATIFAIVAVVVLMVVSVVIGSIAAILLGRPEPGNASFVVTLIISGVVSAIVSVYFTVMVARIYAQLASDPISGT